MPEAQLFTIEGFKSKFGDGAKLSLFYYRPNWPGGITQEINENDAIYLVKTATMPSTTLEETTLNWQGYDWKFAAKHTYSDVTINFNVDKEAKIRMLFEDWSNYIHDPVTNNYEVVANYMADQKLQMLGYDGDVIMEFTLHHAWPKEVGQLSYDYASTEVAAFDVTFSYIYHTVSLTGTGE